MTDGARLVVRNKDRVFRRLREVVPAIAREVEPAAAKGAEEVADQARTWAPRRDGDYAESIVAKPLTEMAARAGSARPIAAWGVFAKWIWRFVEFGTAPRGAHPGTSAQPHLFPAYRVLRKRVVSRISRAIGKAVKRLGS